MEGASRATPARKCSACTLSVLCSAHHRKRTIEADGCYPAPWLHSSDDRSRTVPPYSLRIFPPSGSDGEITDGIVPQTSSDVSSRDDGNNKLPRFGRFDRGGMCILEPHLPVLMLLLGIRECHCYSTSRIYLQHYAVGSTQLLLRESTWPKHRNFPRQ